MGYFKPVILYARNSPTWTNYSYGKNQNVKKKSRKKMLYTCSKITDLYGNLHCFVLAGQFEGGDNNRAPVCTYTYIHIKYHQIIYTYQYMYLCTVYMYIIIIYHCGKIIIKETGGLVNNHAKQRYMGKPMSQWGSVSNASV